MSDPEPNALPTDPVGALVKRAAATAYCRPALKALAAELPADDTILAAALAKAADGREAKAFSHLYLAALYAGRRLAAEVLETGAPLLPEARTILYTALRLEGDVAQALAVAIRSGRMGYEREALSVVVGWLDYERRKRVAPPEFIALTRKICRETVRADRILIRMLLNHAATLSGDAVVAQLLEIDGHRELAPNPLLEQVRKYSTEAGWDNMIPSSPVGETVLGSGATLTRAVPKAGRNDPCPCGSGKKFKQCCAGKVSLSDQYAVDGVTLSEAAAHPELILTAERIQGMRAHELHAFDPHLLAPELVGKVVIRLARFREISRAIEVLQAVGREAFSDDTLDELAYEFQVARDAEALRWLLGWAPGAVELSLEIEVLLAPPAERWELIRRRVGEAFDALRTGEKSARIRFSEIGFAALTVDPAFGILIARGVLPDCGWLDQTALLEAIEDARDVLLLDDDEPGREIVDATDRASIDEARHALDVEKARAESSSRVTQRDAEIQRLKTQIDAMQESLTKREDASAAAAAAREKSTDRSTTAPPPEAAETRELRENLRRLKDNLKVEHEERNRALQELRATRDQLRRATREKPENPAPERPLADHDPEADESDSGGVEWERQMLRIPEYGAAFRESLRRHPRQVAAAALALAGRLAGGDPSTWKTVRSLKLRPGTLRARVAGDYRLLFEIQPGDILRMVDLILRRDLDRWLTAGGR